MSNTFLDHGSSVSEFNFVSSTFYASHSLERISTTIWIISLIEFNFYDVSKDSKSYFKLKQLY